MIPRLINRTPTRSSLGLLGALLLPLLLGACAQTQTPATSEPSATPFGKTPVGDFLVIAHRGASGYRPEHTLAAYQLAIEQGADFIEPDLVPTRDGYLIARHENALAQVELTKDHRIKRDANGAPTVQSATTDVAQRQEFDYLLTVREIDGRPIGGWFSEDFTLAQIQTLHATERIPSLRPENTKYDQLRIPTLQQIIQLLQQPENAGVGMYPELKHPSHFLFGTRLLGPQLGQSAVNQQRKPPTNNLIGIDTAKMLVETLQSQGFTSQQRLYIQCFEVATLRRLHNQLLPAANFTAPLVQLFGALERTIPDVNYHRRRVSNGYEQAMVHAYGPLAATFSTSATYQDLVEVLAIAADDYVSGLGPRKGDLAQLARKAAGLGLELHPYTVRAEPFFLSRLRGAVGSSVDAELDALRGWGATGVFIDQPDKAVSWRSARAQQTAITP